MTTKRTYLVTGATGRVGSKVARKLLDAGHAVRAFGRNRERLAPLAALGAIPVVGDMHDLASVEAAFRGADAALLCCQGHPHAHDYRAEFARAGATYAAAARTTGLPHAVFVSTLGVHDDRNRGVILIHADVERVLNTVPSLNLVHLRAPSFYENIFYFLEPLKAAGVLTWPIASHAPLDMASTSDVADRAVRRLLALDFERSSAEELHGPALVTLAQIANMVARATGRPITAQPASRVTDVEGMVHAGLGRDFAHLMNDAWDSFSRHLVRGVVDPTPASMLPTRVGEFIETAVAPLLVAP